MACCIDAVSVLAVLREHPNGTTREAICAHLGIKRARRIWWSAKKVAYSNRAYSLYRRVGVVLQNLKKYGFAQYGRGGWTITSFGKLHIMEYKRLPKGE